MADATLRLFVAMPGTDMGSSADWKLPEEIKNEFYEPIREALSVRLDREVTLVVEKDKVLAGPIHASMFKEALTADVYIADLTGNNANVYLELGARWTSRDAVTVVVSQNVSEILFNAAASRAIQYAKGPASLRKAKEEVVKAILDELTQSDYCDSPVRQAGKLVTYDRNFVEQLQSENMRLKAQRGEDLFAAAVVTEEPSERLRLLREASRINPSRSDVLVELGAELRKQAQFEESVSVLKRATALDPRCVEAFRELGIVYGKIQKRELAVTSLEEAVRLNPEYAETLRNLGGALRRWGLRDAPGHIDWNALRQSRDRYAAAASQEPHNTYSLLNVAKVELLLSKDDPSRLQAAMDQFGKVKPLCEFNVSDNRDDPWRRFDLAESHLFSGQFQKGYELYKEAIQKVDARHRESDLTSVLSPLTELLLLDVVSGDLQKAVRKVSTLIKKEIATARNGVAVQ